MRLAGVEPATQSLGRSRSIQFELQAHEAYGEAPIIEVKITEPYGVFRWLWKVQRAKALDEQMKVGLKGWGR